MYIFGFVYFYFFFFVNFLCIGKNNYYVKICGIRFIFIWLDKVVDKEERVEGML